MIDRTELLALANQLNLEPRVVEKDYVLGWILAGIFRDPDLAHAWVFKGGTCLKKCFFETYRFSEDLDFTLTDTAQLNQAYLIKKFTALGTWLYDETGIELPANLLRFDVFNNRRGRPQGEGRIAYRGPIAPRGGDLPRIRLDLTGDETLVLDPVERRVNHPYSDEPEDGITARCYAFDEVFGEKVRALGERARPRDLYDVINLHRNAEFHAVAERIRDVVRQKCTYKDVPFPTLEALGPFQEELVGEWNNMLGHQLPALPPVESFWGALPEFFDWLSGTAEPTVLEPQPGFADTLVLRAPAGGIVVPGRDTPFIETIRFAAANRLLVELDYVDMQGNRRQRPIEPYSLRRTRDDNVILCAVNVERQESRSYRVDQIQGARILERSFVPRYAIELTPTGPLAIPATQRGSGGGRSSFGSGFSTPRARSAGRGRSSGGGPVHIFRCPVCGKTFQRKEYDATLRPHKGRNGYQCYGTVGTFVRTTY